MSVWVWLAPVFFSVCDPRLECFGVWSVSWVFLSVFGVIPVKRFMWKAFVRSCPWSWVGFYGNGVALR